MCKIGCNDRLQWVSLECRVPEDVCDKVIME